MSPAPGERLVRHVGDRVVIRLRRSDGQAFPAGWRARLRTTLGRVAAARSEIIARHGGSEPFAGSAWRDISLRREDDGTFLADLPLTEIGWFHAKAFAIDEAGHQHWPDGGDIGLSVHPDHCRSANTIYCAFPRQFGATRTQASTANPILADQLALLDRHGFTVIPPSGTLRDLRDQIPHIVDRLGCRILHLLPITPTPTTYARYGRYGSPYAVQDLIAIDPALVVFDKRTTGIDQFHELVDACHSRDCQVYLDVVLNHTGWGSTVQERQPQFFKRHADGTFHSPGAWGTVWEDLVELDHGHSELWDVLAEALLVWCRRGVDGYRCDAGYMVPLPAWQYIIARVRQEFPDTVFLLEGLGGAWSLTETLLAEGGMQWAYSELFQNYRPQEIAGYLDHLIAHTGRVGTLVHYSETHDNDRLAKRGRAWSLLRNRLCALLSQQGCFGFTAGVEWLASEKISVHGCSGLNWDAADGIVDDLAHLNHLISDHPCWFDGATLERISADDAALLLVRRRSADGSDEVLIAANLDLEAPADLDPLALGLHGAHDLISGSTVPGLLVLEAGVVVCLARSAMPRGLHGEAYREARARAAMGYRLLGKVLSIEQVGPIAWTILAEHVDRGIDRFLQAAVALDRDLALDDLDGALTAAADAGALPPCVIWRRSDVRRILCIPHGHWLVIRDDERFTARLHRSGNRAPLRMRSVRAAGAWWAAFAPNQPSDATVSVEAHLEPGGPLTGTLRFLGPGPRLNLRSAEGGILLLTNGRGGMLRLHSDLGRITSKYDCLLGANLHPQVPVDRHVLVKRLRAWCVADGFVTALDGTCLARTEDGGAARWLFVANAGDGRTAEIHLTIAFQGGRNALTIALHRPEGPPLWGSDLADEDVRVTLRFDLEDRGFHGETRRDEGLDAHWNRCTTALPDGQGFRFAPAPGRHLVIQGPPRTYQVGAEWCQGIAHPVEADRGMAAAGDAWSPGWFGIPLRRGETAVLGVSAEDDLGDLILPQPQPIDPDAFRACLGQAAKAYLVRRDDGHSVIAGYPWFLDWGRDTLICARGLLALGHDAEVLGLLRVFGRFESGGTLPNCIHGEDATNRETSDAPLWYGVVCEDAAARLSDGRVYGLDVGGRDIAAVLRDIAQGHLAGTSTGVHVDPASGLVWSPSHFTWMDTNHPAGTPRIGYPIEIQVLWWRLLRQLGRIDSADPRWKVLADRVAASIDRLYWMEDRGWYADNLIAPGGTSADEAVADTVLRPNALFGVSLGLFQGRRAQRLVEAARTHLVVPGAIRSLAPLPAYPPLAIRSGDGALLNDPVHPYWGTYHGDEDTRRKPAYHNGTAWVWPFPAFCEALALAYGDTAEARAAARSYLGSCDQLLGEGCLGQLPEILDGDAPHRQRGCDAQAWSITEVARVWEFLREA